MLEETERNAIPSGKFPSAFPMGCSHDPRACSKAMAVWMVKELDFEHTASRTHRGSMVVTATLRLLHLRHIW